MPNDFNPAIVNQVEHRPWPLPRSPWIMTQTWHDLLFAHWPLDPAALGSHIPSSIELDLFEGRAWLGVIPFHMSNVAPRGVPGLPWLSAFPELNVRTYVKVGGKPGVYFFSLDAGNWLAVRTARSLFHLPYFTAAMKVARRDGDIAYSSRRTMKGSAPAQFVAAYRPVGTARHAQPGTLDHFLTERYCLYVVDRGLRPLRLEIHHPPWPLQPADAGIEINTMASAAGVVLPGQDPVLHFAKRLDVLTWPLTRAG